MKTIELIFIYILFSCLTTFAEPYLFRGLTGADGLSDLTVAALYKDSCGYVWIGTSTTVERFDGIRVKRYPIPGANEKLKWVNTICETSGNRIWMGNDMGLWQVDGDSLCRIEPDMIDEGVRCIRQGSDGALYVASEKGLYLYKDGKFESRLIDPNILSSCNFIISLYVEDAKGRLWMVTRNGLYVMGIKDGKITHYPNTLIAEGEECSYRTMTCVGTDLYIGTMTHGILRFDMRTHTFSRYLDVGCDVIMALSSDGKNLMYVGTDGNGVHVIATQKKEIIHSFHNMPGKKPESGLRSNSVYSLLVDREGELWVGLYQNGIDYTVHQEHLFSLYKTSYFTSENISVRSVCIGKQEKLIGTRNGLYYVDERNRSVKRFGMPILRSNIILTCYALGDKIYIGTYGGGMYVFDKESKEITDFSKKDGAFTHNSVFHFASDKEGRLWIGASTGVYCYENGSQVCHFDSKNSPLPEGNVYTVYFDSMHRGWICTENGIALWDPDAKTIKRDVFPEDFPYQTKAGFVYEDSRHILYFVPYKGNVFTSDLALKQVREIGPGTLLAGKEVRFITEGRDSCLWIGTNDGIFRRDKTGKYLPFSYASGIPDLNFLPCIPAVDEDGTIWFGNNKGLLSLPADWEQKRSKLPYAPRITGIRVNGLPASLPVRKGTVGDKVALETEQNNVSFLFSGFTFSDPAYVAYEYKLEGVDNDWKTLYGKSEMEYYNLNPGSYVFKVRRMGETDTEAALAVDILSTSYPVVWVAIIVFCCFVTSVVFFYYRKKNRKTEPVVSAPSEMPVLPQEPALPADELVKPESNAVESAKEKYRTSNVSEAECKSIVKKLEKLMEEDKLYTNPDLKLNDLAAAVEVSTYTLSYIFNQYLNQNYYDYINEHRLERFKELVARKAHTKYTLNILIEKCGFGSRASFFRYFKKVTGITPNEYIKRFG